MLEHEIEVRRGIALLDRVRPGWIDEVDLGKLNINCCLDCVLGQLFGDYRFGYYELRLDTIPERQFYGFSYDDGLVESTTLTNTWRILIQEERKKRQMALPIRILEGQKTREYATAN